MSCTLTVGSLTFSCRFEVYPIAGATLKPSLLLHLLGSAREFDLANDASGCVAAHTEPQHVKSLRLCYHLGRQIPAVVVVVRTTLVERGVKKRIDHS